MQSPRILIIEDDTVLLRLYSQVLTIHQYIVSRAETMQQAQAHLTSSTFDLLLADVQMGAERSTDLIRDMRDMLRQSGTQIILMSAEERYRSLRDELGLDSFVVKPVAPSELVALVDRFLPLH